MRRFRLLLALPLVLVATACGGASPTASDSGAGSEAATTQKQKNLSDSSPRAPKLVLESSAGSQEAVPGSSCITGEGVGVCSDTGYPRPKQLSIVRPGEVITVSLEQQPDPLVGRHLDPARGAAPRGLDLDPVLDVALVDLLDPEGTTTAGNAPGVNDGAGALVVTSEEFARERGLEILATIVSQAYVADDFAYLARTTALAGLRALEKAGKSIDDVKRVELNEAFSSVVLNSTAMLGTDPEHVNVNGGAVALGHPIGASGARILATMIHELRRNGGGLGLAAICSGGGQGDALVIDV